jgi:hypothetical protein
MLCYPVLDFRWLSADRIDEWKKFDFYCLVSPSFDTNEFGCYYVIKLLATLGVISPN